MARVIENVAARMMINQRQKALEIGRRRGYYRIRGRRIDAMVMERDLTA